MFSYIQVPSESQVELKFQPFCSCIIKHRKHIHDIARFKHHRMTEKQAYTPPAEFPWRDTQKHRGYARMLSSNHRPLEALHSHLAWSFINQGVELSRPGPGVAAVPWSPSTLSHGDSPAGDRAPWHRAMLPQSKQRWIWANCLPKRPLCSALWAAASPSNIYACRSLYTQSTCYSLHWPQGKWLTWPIPPHLSPAHTAGWVLQYYFPTLLRPEQEEEGASALLHCQVLITGSYS